MVKKCKIVWLLSIFLIFSSLSSQVLARCELVGRSFQCIDQNLAHRSFKIEEVDWFGTEGFRVREFKTQEALEGPSKLEETWNFSFQRDYDLNELFDLGMELETPDCTGTSIIVPHLTHPSLGTGMYRFFRDTQALEETYIRTFENGDEVEKWTCTELKPEPKTKSKPEIAPPSVPTSGPTHSVEKKKLIVKLKLNRSALEKSSAPRQADLRPKRTSRPTVRLRDERIESDVEEELDHSSDLPGMTDLEDEPEKKATQKKRPRLLSDDELREKVLELETQIQDLRDLKPEDPEDQDDQEDRDREIVGLSKLKRKFKNQLSARVSRNKRASSAEIIGQILGIEEKNPTQLLERCAAYLTEVKKGTEKVARLSGCESSNLIELFKHLDTQFSPE